MINILQYYHRVKPVKISLSTTNETDSLIHINHFLVSSTTKITKQKKKKQFGKYALARVPRLVDSHRQSRTRFQAPVSHTIGVSSSLPPHQLLRSPEKKENSSRASRRPRQLLARARARISPPTFGRIAQFLIKSSQTTRIVYKIVVVARAKRQRPFPFSRGHRKKGKRDFLLSDGRATRTARKHCAWRLLFSSKVRKFRWEFPQVCDGSAKPVERSQCSVTVRLAREVVWRCSINTICYYT